MSESKMILHCGARHASRDELALVPAPAPTATWFPLSHLTVVERCEKTLQAAGFSVEKSTYGLSRGDNRFFGTLDLSSAILQGVTLAVGIRNSTDKSLPIGFCAGARVLVCDNLAFRSEVTIARKHTRNGETRFAEALSSAVAGLHAFREQEAKRVQALQFTDVTNERAESLILRAYEADIVSHRTLPSVLKEWREPAHEEFLPRTLWSLFNSFTAALSERRKTNAQQFAHLTIRLNDLFAAAAGLDRVSADDELAAQAV